MFPQLSAQTPACLCSRSCRRNHLSNVIIRSRGATFGGATPQSRPTMFHTPTKPNRPLTPLSEPRAGTPTWHPVIVNQSMLTIKGGYSTRCETANSISVNEGETDETFVELDKNAPWFRHGAGGMRVEKGDMKAVDVIKLLRHECMNALHESPDKDTVDAANDTAVAEEPPPDDDPMNALDNPEDLAPKTPQPRKKKHTQ